ncbi:hypothetical protein Zmor_024676 [Zophobas morio]|uniref:Uncharacterized protein n=1 Tax=Zophobas morio TaxID=2755281 RepID=A0AA38I3P0_9CUCU|nr:hypothetical protein Zmor_024676 [Zophobas morio]
MCNVPPKFYQLCRLCLSVDKEPLPIFDDGSPRTDLPTKIMTCLSILVRDSLSDKSKSTGPAQPGPNRPPGPAWPPSYFQRLLINTEHLPRAALWIAFGRSAAGQITNDDRPR